MFRKKADAEGAEQVELSNEAPADSTPTNVPGQVAPLTETTNEALTAKKGADKSAAPREPRERKQRGPPEDGVPSKTKVMVANLPYDLKEDRVRCSNSSTLQNKLNMEAIVLRAFCTVRGQSCSRRPSGCHIRLFMQRESHPFDCMY
jgi:hypothetical protein